MKRLIRLLERKLGMSWTMLTEWLRGQNALDAITARLEARDYAGVVADIESAAQRFATVLHEAYVEAGQRTATWLDKQLPGKLPSFDSANPRAVERARQNRLELVRGLTAEQRDITRNVLVDGLSRGANPREMARDLRDSIGLTPTQEQHVRNYRRALETGQFHDASRRQLHDDRYNRTLTAARRDGVQLTPAQVDKMVERYRTNYVAYRAEVIARTEALRAAHEGTEELYRQAIERGDVEAKQLVRIWNAGPATLNARDEHQAMDGVSVPIGEDFVMPDGTRMRHPGDPRGGTAHTAQCRCAVSTAYDPAA